MSKANSNTYENAALAFKHFGSVAFMYICSGLKRAQLLEEQKGLLREQWRVENQLGIIERELNIKVNTDGSRAED